jgi:hypothetical protein
VSSPLPQSREADIAANREAHINGRQLLGLVYSGLWRTIAGLPSAALGAVAIWSLPGDPAGNVVGTSLGLLFLGLGMYMLWRGVCFLVDAVTRQVALVTARVDRDVTYSPRSGNLYYMVVGPVKTWIAPKVFDALPIGLLCHAFFSPCSLHLLSIEPATPPDPYLSERLGGADAYAWARFRWGGFFAALAAFGLAAAIHYAIVGHPAVALRMWVRKHPQPPSTALHEWSESDITDEESDESSPSES